MKEITKKGIETLIDNNLLHNSPKGYVDINNCVVGFYRTKHKRYIEDKYVNVIQSIDKYK